MGMITYISVFQVNIPHMSITEKDDVATNQ